MWPVAVFVLCDTARALGETSKPVIQGMLLRNLGLRRSISPELTQDPAYFTGHSRSVQWLPRRRPATMWHYTPA